MSPNTDILWILVTVVFAVAAISAVLTAVGLRILVRDSRQPAAHRAPVRPMQSHESATATVGQAA